MYGTAFQLLGYSVAQCAQDDGNLTAFIVSNSCVVHRRLIHWNLFWKRGVDEDSILQKCFDQGVQLFMDKPVNAILNDTYTLTSFIIKIQ
jgi:hypothetical protein